MFRFATATVLCCGLLGGVVRADDPAPKGLQVPEGMRAVAVKVKNDMPVVGFILPGSRVDVIVVEGKGKNQKAQVLLKDVLVLAFDAPLPKDEDKDKKPIPEMVIITVAVSKDDAQKLAVAAQKNEIRLALRQPDEKEKK
jgi:pilus assembly protein CpaB